MIIGISGGSCSGKSTLAKHLIKKLDHSSLVHFDDFFVGKENIDTSTIKSWEEPNLYRLDEYLQVLQNLKQGKETKMKANSRESRKSKITTRIIKPTKYIIFEGFLLFHPKGSSDFFDKKIYLDISEKEIIRRKYKRMNEGGGKYSDEYINKTLIEAHRKYIIPQEKHANLTLSATEAIEFLVNKALNFILNRHTG